MAPLIPDLTRFLHASLAPSTTSTYRSAWASYNTFCMSVGALPYPCQQILLLFYVTYLARRVSYSTIKVYLAAIQFHSYWLGHDTKLAEMHQLFYALRGIRRQDNISHRRPPRRPITLHHLSLLFQFINNHVKLAFSGMLRSSEYTSPSISCFDSDSTLLITDISFTADNNLALIHIKQSKTDLFKAGCSLRVSRAHIGPCPVTSLLAYLEYHRYHSGPLYRFHGGAFLTRRLIADFLQQALPLLSNLNTHSFRIGGASAAASAESGIQILGRWKSDAYRRYIRLSDTTVSDMTQRISQIPDTTRSYRADRNDIL